MTKVRLTKLKYFLLASLFGFVLVVWAAEEEEPEKSSFAMCLDELKEATSGSTDEETENDFEPELSLEESIRIYDECLKREGVTLSIHGTLGESGGTGTGEGSSVSQLDKNGSDDGAQTGTTSDNTSNQSNDLESSLQDFDQMLAQMQEEIDADRAKQQAAATSEIAQTPLEATSEDQDATEETSGEESEGSLLNQSAMTSSEAKHEDTSERVPLDPKDEDIILKTIREAAEIETDPTTKQALWDQYYEYADKQ